MLRISADRWSRIAIGILLLVIIRSLSEFFRLRYEQADALSIAAVAPYVGSALFTTVVLAAALAAHSLARYRLSVALMVATVVVLLVYKIAVIG